MNIQQIASYLHRPQNLDMSSINELEALVAEYPFFNGARILLARACKNQEDHRFARYLKAAALYAGDRKRLFHYLETDPSALEQSPLPEERTEDIRSEGVPEIGESIQENQINVKEEEPEAEPIIEDQKEEETEEQFEEKIEQPQFSEERKSRNEKTERDNAEFVLRNLDDWDDVVYEEHSEHKAIAGLNAGNREPGDIIGFEEKEKEIKEDDQQIDKLRDLPADEAADPAFTAVPEEDEQSSEEKTFDETREMLSHNNPQAGDESSAPGYGQEELDNIIEAGAITAEDNSVPGEKLSADTAVWENESFPEEVALSEATELDEEEGEEEPDFNPEPGGRYRFEEWLSALQVISRLEKKESDEMEAAEAERKKEDERRAEQLVEKQEIDPKAGTRDIIEKFLQEEPTISKPHAEFFKPRNMARQSEQFHEDEWATETLASIYAKQGHSERAIRIYEKLMLQMPDKKAYFASLIEELNKKR